VTFEEWHAAIVGFLGHPDYRPGMGVLHDWRALLEAPQPLDVRRRADYLERHVASFRFTRWALVVSRSATYGMGRIEQTLLNGSPVEIRIFRDLAEAEAWARGG